MTSSVCCVAWHFPKLSIYFGIFKFAYKSNYICQTISTYCFEIVLVIEPLVNGILSKIKVVYYNIWEALLNLPYMIFKNRYDLIYICDLFLFLLKSFFNSDFSIISLQNSLIIKELLLNLSVFFFLSGFSFTKIYCSQGSRRRGRLSL